MTTLSQPRSIIETEGKFSRAPVKAATTIFQGGIVVMENGLAVPGKTAVGLTVIGIAESGVVNSGADGAASVDTRRGTFKFVNLAADPILAGDIGKDCYLVDDQTVAKTNGSSTRSVAGKIFAVQSDGVFVRLGY